VIGLVAISVATVSREDCSCGKAFNILLPELIRLSWVVVVTGVLGGAIAPYIGAVIANIVRKFRRLKSKFLNR